MEDSNKYIIEEIVRQVGYLPELYEDARLEKYKIKNMSTMRNSEVVSDIFNVESGLPDGHQHRVIIPGVVLIR